MLINIIFTKPKNYFFISELVAFVQKTDFSHVCISFDNKLFQANNDTGVTVTDLEEFLKENNILHSFTISVSAAEFYKYMNQVTGRPYSSYQAFIVGVFITIKRAGLKLRIPKVNGKEAFICSEIIGDVLIMADMMKKKSLDTFSPVEAFAILKRYKTV